MSKIMFGYLFYFLNLKLFEKKKVKMINEVP